MKEYARKTGPAVPAAHAIYAWILACRPPRIAMLLLLVAAIWHWFSPAPAVMSFPLTAALLVVAGYGMMSWAWWQFQQREVAVCPTAETRALITDGLYGYTRNPMYLGIVMMLGGITLWFGTVPFAIATMLFFLTIQLAFCPFEERKLEASFCEDYIRYRTQVRRWI